MSTALLTEIKKKRRRVSHGHSRKWLCCVKGNYGCSLLQATTEMCTLEAASLFKSRPMPAKGIVRLTPFPPQRMYHTSMQIMNNRSLRTQSAVASRPLTWYVHSELSATNVLCFALAFEIRHCHSHLLHPILKFWEQIRFSCRAR